jgi:uncharacterized membrane protein YeaQ/YmgE (transglycosylase-associated protein family)
MSIVSILVWLVYGVIVGLLAKALHPGDDPVGFLPTVGIGVAGSYIGGFINFLLGRGDAFSPSGIIMGIVGGILFLIAWRWWNLQNAEGGARNFWTGKRNGD